MNQTQRRLLWGRLAGIAAEHGHIACLGSDGVDIDVRCPGSAIASASL